METKMFPESVKKAIELLDAEAEPTHQKVFFLALILLLEELVEVEHKIANPYRPVGRP